MSSNSQINLSYISSNESFKLAITCNSVFTPSIEIDACCSEHEILCEMCVVIQKIYRVLWIVAQKDFMIYKDLQWDLWRRL